MHADEQVIAFREHVLKQDFMSVMKAVKATDRQHVSALSGSSATTESFVRHPSDAGYYYNTMSVSLASKTKKNVENAMSAMPPEIAQQGQCHVRSRSDGNTAAVWPGAHIVW